MNYAVIDLFAGAGGFSNGFLRSGFKITTAIEFDKDIAQTYKENHPKTKLLVEDIKDVIEKDLLKVKSADVVIGGPPCQGFSMAGARIRKNFMDDPRNQLFKSYCDILSIVKPKVFIFENVKGILSMEDGAVFKDIIKSFSNKDNFGGNSYFLYYKVFNAIDFGIPQKRERVFVIGTLNKNIDINKYLKQAKTQIQKEFPSFFETPTVWDAISNLNNEDEQGKIPRLQYHNNYQKSLKSSIFETYNHIKPKHSKTAENRMKKIKQGENWTALDEDIKSVHSGSYGRLKKDGIAPTITTRFDTPSGGGFTHPFEDRTLSPREGARMQSFPDSFKFIGNKTSIYKQIGNAVPPKISLFFARVINNILKDEYE